MTQIRPIWGFLFGEPIPALAGWLSLASLVAIPLSLTIAGILAVGGFCYMTMVLFAIRPYYRGLAKDMGLAVLTVVPVCPPMVRLALRQHGLRLPGCPGIVYSIHVALRSRVQVRWFARALRADVDVLFRLAGEELWLLLDLDLGLPGGLDRLLSSLELRGMAVSGKGYLFGRQPICLKLRSSWVARRLGWRGRLTFRQPRFYVIATRELDTVNTK